MDEPKILIGLDFSVASREVIEILLDDTEDPHLFQEIARTNTGRPDILQLLYEHADTPEDVRGYIAGLLHMPAKTPAAAVRAKKPQEAKTQNIMMKLQSLGVGERIQLALKGGREIRSILIKDTNKEVMLSVLENQKITETEVELIARSRSIPDEVLRRIAKNREWIKSYAIVHALVTNPKTPPGISVSMVGTLKLKDIAILEKNKNVPEVIRSVAKKLLSARRPK